jgi:hypothetical protein
MLPGFQTDDCLLLMERVRRTDENDIEIRVGGESLERCVGVKDAVS